LEKPPCRLGIPARLYKNIKNVSPRVDRAPQPMLFATDRYNDFVHVPLVVRSRSIPTNAICEVSAKAIDPKPDHFSTDNHTPRRQQIFSIRCAQGKSVVRSDSVRNDFTWITKALQAW
jgi:hypothetical protein